MRTMMSFVVIVTILKLLGGATLGSAHDVPLVPAYIEQKNGTFAICAFDGAKDTIFKYRGLFISKQELPEVSIIRPQLIFARDKNERKDAGWAEQWSPRQEDLYLYGEIPYSVQVVDPPP